MNICLKKVYMCIDILLTYMLLRKPIQEDYYFNLYRKLTKQPRNRKNRNRHQTNCEQHLFMDLMAPM